MTGMRAVADPSLVAGQLYVGLKKGQLYVELDDDGNGNRWRAHEYTPLLPPDDDPSKLVPAVTLSPLSRPKPKTDNKRSKINFQHSIYTGDIF